jgi:hypothetical protein
MSWARRLRSLFRREELGWELDAELAFHVAERIDELVDEGLAPASRPTRGDLNQALKEDARSTVLGTTRFHLGKTLVAGQIALSLMLLVAAGLSCER